MLLAAAMTQTGESPVVPAADLDLDEVLRSLEVEMLFPDLALPRQNTAPTGRSATPPTA